MREKSFVSILALLAALCSCTPRVSSSNLASQPQYDAAVVPGSRTNDDLLVKLNHVSGEGWIHFGGGKNDRFQQIGEKIAPRAGDYRLVTWSTVDPSGAVYFNVYRFDVRSGHSWILKVPSQDASYWFDVNTSVSAF